MKINETLEQEIATRLGITRPNCPKDVAEYIADLEAFSEAVSRYERPNFSWRATTEEARATIAEARKSLTTLEQYADKVDSHSDTIALATTAYYDLNRKYWDTIENEAQKPKNAFDKARSEFITEMDREARSLKRKENKLEWGTDERNQVSERLELVRYMAEQARYLDYNAETSPVFTEQVLWEQISKAEYRANSFLRWIAKSQELAN